MHSKDVMGWFIETFFFYFKNWYFPELIWTAAFVTLESTKIIITLGFEVDFFNSRNLNLCVIYLLIVDILNFMICVSLNSMLYIFYEIFLVIGAYYLDGFFGFFLSI